MNLGMNVMVLDVNQGAWKLETERGSWASLPNYMVSLLKAWYGDYAMKENEYGFQWLPKLAETNL